MATKVETFPWCAIVFKICKHIEVQGGWRPGADWVEALRPGLCPKPEFRDYTAKLAGEVDSLGLDREIDHSVAITFS